MNPLDTNVQQQDWNKGRHWDIWDMQGLVDSKERLAAAIYPMTIEHFMTLPAARAMPDKLRKEING